MNIRQRVRKVKICCKPWKHYRGEIRTLPISSQCLFSNKGEPWDILEISLRSEGFLLENENLWDVLSDKNRMIMDINDIKTEDEPWDDTWTEEDYVHFYNRLQGD